MALFSAPGQLPLDVPIDRVLGPDKAFEIERIGHKIPWNGLPEPCQTPAGPDYA
ncbi:hypothetical protein BF49_0852 [Bradyrhizobium sp.]|nr:hypothetical protein BF49_0852 [Bradyrhizobium sp.]